MNRELGEGEGTEFIFSDAARRKKIPRKMLQKKIELCILAEGKTKIFLAREKFLLPVYGKKCNNNSYYQLKATSLTYYKEHLIS